MRTKNFFRWSFITLPLAILAVLFIGTLSARAQCGNPQPSSCKTCHAQEAPLTDQNAWHLDHASQDLCVNCHGGNGSTMDKNLAHISMTVQPLSDVYTNCHSCHPNYAALAAPYAATLQVTPSSGATPTPAAAGNFSSSGLPPNNSIIMPSNLTNAALPLQPFLFITAGLALLILFCVGVCWMDRHRVKL